MSLQLCCQPSEDFDDSVQVPTLPLVTVGNAVHAQVMAAIYDSLTIFIHFVRSLGVPSATVTLDLGRTFPHAHHVSLFDGCPEARERSFQSTAHTLDGYRKPPQMPCSVSALGAVRDDNRLHLEDALDTDAVLCTPRRKLLHSTEVL